MISYPYDDMSDCGSDDQWQGRVNNPRSPSPTQAISTDESESLPSEEEDKSDLTRLRNIFARVRAKREKRREQVQLILEQQENQVNYPQAFFCPLTKQVLQDPVLDREGQTYERHAILEWLHQTPTSPMTRKPMAVDDLVPNLALRQAIQEYKESMANHVVVQQMRQSQSSSMHNSPRYSMAECLTQVRHATGACLLRVTPKSWKLNDGKYCIRTEVLDNAVPLSFLVNTTVLEIKKRWHNNDRIGRMALEYNATVQDVMPGASLSMTKTPEKVDCIVLSGVFAWNHVTCGTMQDLLARFSCLAEKVAKEI